MATLLPVRYNVTDKALAELKVKYDGIKVTDADSYEIARKGIAETRSLRGAVEEERKSLKASALDYGRRVDAEAKRITAALLAIEEPLKAEKQKVDDEKERIRAEKAAKEQVRIDAIQNRISDIQKLHALLVNLESSKIQELIDRVAAIMITTSVFQEFVEQAGIAKQEFLTAANEAFGKRVIYELEEQDRKAEIAKLEKLRKEQEAEKKKIEAEKAAIEAEKKAEIQRKEREEFERKALERAEAEAKEKIAREAKAAQEKAEREAAEKARREENERLERIKREMMAPDKDKLLKWVASFNDTNIQRPSLKSPEAREILRIAEEHIEMILQDAEKKAEAL